MSPAQELAVKVVLGHGLGLAFLGSDLLNKFHLLVIQDAEVEASAIEVLRQPTCSITYRGLEGNRGKTTVQETHAPFPANHL